VRWSALSGQFKSGVSSFRSGPPALWSVAEHSAYLLLLKIYTLLSINLLWQQCGVISGRHLWSHD